VLESFGMPKFTVVMDGIEAIEGEVDWRALGRQRSVFWGRGSKPAAPGAALAHR
jgi:hypothetical protein